MDSRPNIDHVTVEGFGEEWTAYDQSSLSEAELRQMFECYFSIFSFEGLGEGFDLGCGSGRWARLVAPRVQRLHCIDPSEKALAVARRNLAPHANVVFHEASADSVPLPDESQDFGYSLGVLHHTPDPEAAMRACVRKLKPRAQFLVYLYYAFDNRPAWFRAIWKTSDLLRRGIWRMPFPLKKSVTTVLAASVYFPLARSAQLLERLGADVSNFPLSSYRAQSFYTMRTDALDRFGTHVEHRFTRAEIEGMMHRSGLTDIRFSDGVPYWVAIGRKA